MSNSFHAAARLRNHTAHLPQLEAVIAYAYGWQGTPTQAANASLYCTPPQPVAGSASDSPPPYSCCLDDSSSPLLDGPWVLLQVSAATQALQIAATMCVGSAPHAVDRLSAPRASTHEAAPIPSGGDTKPE